jgi:lysine-N-methylase
VALPIRTLPVVEKWDCHSCGQCCRGTTIPLDDKDRAKLRKQQWGDHADFRGVRTVVRESLLGGRHVLAKKSDGSCVFLSDENRCRIHELHGAQAKPALCRMFPFQLISLDSFAYLTPRRSCPSAAADRGRPLDEHLVHLKRSALEVRSAVSETAPPAVVRGARRSWRAFLGAADVLARLTTDERWPLVRRLVHGLQFCELMAECKLARVKEKSWRELMQSLEAAATQGAGELFRDRQPPSRSTASLFRQAGVHYIRSHPGFPSTGQWRERWWMMWISARFVRGKGPVPLIHPEFPATTFQMLERPLGPLAEDVSRPLVRYFETHAISKQYAVMGGKRSLVETYRALVLTYPVALWLLRWAIGQRNTTLNDVVNIVVALERGQGMTALVGSASAMANSQQLQRLVAWYAR